MLGKQHHIAVICSNWDAAREFYVNKLGFELIREIYRPAQNDYLRMLQLGEPTLELFLRPAAPRRVYHGRQARAGEISTTKDLCFAHESHEFSFARHLANARRVHRMVNINNTKERPVWGTPSFCYMARLDDLSRG